MSLHQLVNRQADDFLAMCAFFLLLTCSQKMKNNYVYGLSNPALRQAQEGVVDLHLPPVDMTAVLKEVDREFVKQHPLMKKVLEEESGVGGKGEEESGRKGEEESGGKREEESGGKGEEESGKKRERDEKGEKEEKRRRVRVSTEAFLDVNTPLKDEKEEEKTVVISDAEIEANRLSADEMMKLPQMRNVRVGGRVFL